LSDGGPDALLALLAVADMVEEGVFGVVACVSAVRKGEGATSERWKRVRKAAASCACSLPVEYPIAFDTEPLGMVMCSVGA